MSNSALISMKTILCGAAGVAVAALIAGAAVTLSPSQAQATAAYAKETGKPCGACHVNPAGGGKLTAAGLAFQKSHKK